MSSFGAMALGEGMRNANRAQLEKGGRARRKDVFEARDGCRKQNWRMRLETPSSQSGDKEEERKEGNANATNESSSRPRGAAIGGKVR